MRWKAMMLIVGIIAIGLFALPSTLAMYTGQHDFIEGDYVDCDKCHTESDPIYGELAGGPHSSFTCKQCHGFETSNPNINNGSMGHAATASVTCVGCHSNTNYAGGSGGLDGDGITVADELAVGAHDELASYGDADLSCIGCHTSVAVAGTIGSGEDEGTIILDPYNL